MSKFFFEKDFCVHNGISADFHTPFDQYVRNIASEWTEYVLTWTNIEASLYRYEDFLRAPVSTLQTVVDSLNITVNDEQLELAVKANTKDKTSQSLAKTFKHNTFVRKGVAGDWTQHFDQQNIHDFNTIAGEALQRLGYDIFPNS